MGFYRSIRCLGFVSIFMSVASLATAQSFPQLRPGAQVPEYCGLKGQPITVTINGRRASGSNFFTPGPIDFVMDVSVEGGNKQVMLTMANEEQYKAMSAGRKPTGEPVMKEIFSGVGSSSVRLTRGNYFVGFNNTGDAPIRLSYRCSIIRR